MLDEKLQHSNRYLNYLLTHTEALWFSASGRPLPPSSPVEIISTGRVRLMVNDELTVYRVVHRVPAHPIICWLAKHIPIQPYVETVRYEDRVVMYGNIPVISRALRQRLFPNAVTVTL